MRRFLNSTFLAWAVIFAVGVGLLALAFGKDWSPPPPHPYPVSANVNVSRAMSLQSAAAAMPSLAKDPAARQQWCADNVALARTFAASAAQESTPLAGSAFSGVAEAFTGFCADPSRRAAVGVSLNNLATVVSGGPVAPPTTPAE